MMQIEEEEKETELTQRVKVENLLDPFSKFSIAAGSTIVIEGAVKFDSDKPLSCMSFEFQKEKGLSFNYFTCKTCNDLNWVCEDCTKGCHNGHELLPHMT